MKTFRPLIFFVILLLVVGMACNAMSNNVTAQPEQEEAVQAVEETPPDASAPTEIQAQPTEVPPTEAPSAMEFFTEEFDVNDNWTYFVVDGDSSAITDVDNPKMQLHTENSFLTFDLGGEGLWVYVTYDPFQYEDVRIDARVVNRGVNTNNVSLICRYTESGWYEFNVANNGLYWIYAAQVSSDSKVSYGLVYNGGSNKIKSGRETNEYTAICNGRTLSLFINGAEARTVTENKYGLTSGNVGISVSSFDVLPVAVDVDWFKISEP